MKNILEKSIFILSLFLAISCSNSTNNESKLNSDTVIKTLTEQEASLIKGKYALKSGILQMKATTLGISQAITIYFDDYGNKEMTDVKIDMLGTKKHQIVISDSGKMFTIDLDKKTGSRINSDNQNINNPENFNFLKLTEKSVKDFQIKKEGQAKMLDKVCDVFVIKNSKFSGKFLVWKGIAMKTEVNAMNLKTTIEVTKIQENVNMPAETFQIPKGIKMSEVNLGDDKFSLN